MDTQLDSPELDSPEQAPSQDDGTYRHVSGSYSREAMNELFPDKESAELHMDIRRVSKTHRILVAKKERKKVLPILSLVSLILTVACSLILFEEYYGIQSILFFGFFLSIFCIIFRYRVWSELW